jgi:hypothetical protein
LFGEGEVPLGGVVVRLPVKVGGIGRDGIPAFGKQRAQQEEKKY